MRAALLIAHGSRRKEANDDLHQLTELVVQRGGFDVVEPAFLELAEPDIPAAAARCVERGATEVRMLPYFLSMGVHVAEDLEEHRAAFETQYPGVRFEVRPPLGLHPRLVEVVLERLGEAAEPSGTARLGS
ncbi:sirohydrochlorin chelatase [Alienimonas chondri]|uniref:Sirohydrochlorin cobaltochelatase n=1 Tax=Alienimonas chondri TaxID=2681879 RepID=A0ABX1VH05_9PLAN|nr:CbiX/SirB N-terminal domain-containing protein [Alienimonas chondri]NNJ27079.1 Sirohydrochlorin cobaltochelatase [Alienimonas chondri]